MLFLRRILWSSLARLLNMDWVDANSAMIEAWNNIKCYIIFRRLINLGNGMFYIVDVEWGTR
jgi:hypothetical protein